LGLTILAAGYTSILTAYDLEGLEKIAAEIEQASPREGYLDYNKFITILKSEPQFLRINDPEALKEILLIGTQGAEALNYVLKHQPELCPRGKQHHKNRSGYLFQEGMCSKAEASHAVATINAFLNGPVQVAKTVYTENNQEEQLRYLTEINIGQILEFPIVDLKETLLPSKVDVQSRRIEFADETLGGLFPRGDASTFLIFGADIESKDVQVTPSHELK
jgi:hypothetical protein